MSTLEVIQNILKENADVDPSIVNMDTSLESLGFDSLDVAELVCNVEDELNIDFGNPEQLSSVADVVDHIDSILNA